MNVRCCLSLSQVHTLIIESEADCRWVSRACSADKWVLKQFIVIRWRLKKEKRLAKSQNATAVAQLLLRNSRSYSFICSFKRNSVFVACLFWCMTSVRLLLGVVFGRLGSVLDIGLMGTSYLLFQTLLCSMCCLAIMHSVTDRETDRQTNRLTDKRQYDVNSWSYMLHAVRSTKNQY